MEVIVGGGSHDIEAYILVPEAEASTWEGASTNKKKKMATGTSQSPESVPSVTAKTSAGTGIATSTKRAKNRSVVWDHFTKANEKNKVASYNYCHKRICCDPNKGTSAMKNHIKRCQRNLENQPGRKQKTLQVVKNVEGEGSMQSWKFDQEASKRALARMIIIDELPFRHVEHEGFRDFVSSVQPRFVIPSRWTVARTCYELYMCEKEKLKGYFNNVNQRVSLTTDTWTFIQNLSYMCLTAHFIDSEWKLHKKVLNFCPISGHSGNAIGKAVEKCLVEWGLLRVFAITVDNASANDVGIQYLKRRLNSWGKNILKGEHLHVRCCAHILSLTVKEGLKDLHESIFQIRSAVKFVRSSPLRMQKFKECIEEEKIEDKSLVCLDVETRWNSTYLMLSSAVKFQKAFERLEDKDVKYVGELTNDRNKGLPNEDDWNHARCLLPFLKVFYDATLHVSGSLYVTSNSYFDEVYNIHQVINEACASDDYNLSVMASKMKSKHDKYWGNLDNINIMLYVAVILDPRYKLNYVEWVLEDSYDVVTFKEIRSKVRATLHALFQHYSTVEACMTENTDTSNHPSSDVSGDSTTTKIPKSRMMKYKKWLKEDQGVENKTELDKYLAEETEEDDGNFDTLNWWKVNSSRFRILGLLARDILAVPLSTMASESSFSTGGRVLDQFRSSLTLKIVQALICMQNWLKASFLPVTNEEFFEEIEHFDQELASLASAHGTVVDPTLMIDN